jgi:hypothetical protein
MLSASDSRMPININTLKLPACSNDGKWKKKEKETEESIECTLEWRPMRAEQQAESQTTETTYRFQNKCHVNLRPPLHHRQKRIQNAHRLGVAHRDHMTRA